MEIFSEKKKKEIDESLLNIKLAIHKEIDKNPTSVVDFDPYEVISRMASFLYSHSVSDKLYKEYFGNVAKNNIVPFEVIKGDKND
jgi:hypothetical protein